MDQIVRVRFDDATRWALVRGASLHPYPGSELSALGRPGAAIEATRATLLPAADPRQIFGIGRNHEASGASRPERPPFFAKCFDSLCGTGTPIRLPPCSTGLIAEAEVVAVIGRDLYQASVAEAEDGIFGYMMGNDVTALPVDPWHLFEAKSARNFAPVGNVILRGAAVRDLSLVLAVNGRVEGVGCATALYLAPSEIIRRLSAFVRLYAGDLVFTGALALSRELVTGDEVTVRNPLLGELTNAVVA